MNPSFMLRYMGVSRSFLWRFVVCWAFSLALSATLAWAQATSTATVTGQVTDQQGAAIAGAQVRIIDTATNAAQTSTTNSDGRYVFVNVNPGTYTVSFGKTGFATSRVDQQQVEIGTTLTVNSYPSDRLDIYHCRSPSPSCRRAADH